MPYTETTLDIDLDTLLCSARLYRDTRVDKHRTIQASLSCVFALLDAVEFDKGLLLPFSCVNTAICIIVLMAVISSQF